MTQQELASLLGVSQSAVAAWGADGKGVPPSRAAFIADLLNVEPLYIAVINKDLQPLFRRESVKESDKTDAPSVDDEIIELVQSPNISISDKYLIKQILLRLLG